MYEFDLEDALVPAQGDLQICKITIGELLRKTASEKPLAEALVEVRQDGVVGPRWNYEKLFKDSKRLASALASRFEFGERVVVWAPNSPEWF